MMIEPTGLLPFIPGGSDFDMSRQLFRELGFIESWAANGYVGLKWGEAKFILQDFNHPSFASNLMVKLEVPDIEAWWGVIKPKELPNHFDGFRIKSPTDCPWGREVNFIDLAGVCWHVGQ
jgi:hypothetical protein